jgi:hypothetical protein
MTIFVYLRSGLPERQDSKMHSVTGEGIGASLGVPEWNTVMHKESNKQRSASNTKLHL